eukprot:NODE_252_length_11723_cov_1.965933.p4 type:complete len:339 gc:universal NODE_252_length_11723_cov_1.965933:63-1079(+)
MNISFKKVLNTFPIWNRFLKCWISTVKQDLIVSDELALLNLIPYPYSIEKVMLSESSYINTLKLNGKGRRNTIVMTHGYGAGLGYFYKNLSSLGECLGDVNAIYAIDWLGMGESSRCEIKLGSISDVENYFVDSLEQWRIKLNLKKLILCGHSFGGYLCTVYALKYPENVERLVLISPVGFAEKPLQNFRIPPKFIEICWNFNVTPQTLLRFMGPISYLVVSLMTTNRFKNISHEELVAITSYSHHINVKYRGSGEYAMNPLLLPGAYARKPLIYRYKKISCPIDFIFGKNDWCESEMLVEMTDDLLQHVIHFCDGGHFMFLDHPEKFNNLMVDILKY